MKLFRPLFQTIIPLLFGLLSCSTNDIEQSTLQGKIDLALLNENEWDLSNDILNFINVHRVNRGKNIIAKDSSYATAYAVQHSKYMVATNSVNHNNFFIRSKALKEKGAMEVSENIAYGYSSAETVVKAWLKSDAHREVIEGNFSHIGFGIVKSLENRYYYTTIYYR